MPFTLRHVLALVAALASMAMAQELASSPAAAARTSVVTFTIPPYTARNGGFNASVITVVSGMTSYSVVCPTPAVPFLYCLGDMTQVQGSSTMERHRTYTVQRNVATTENMECSLKTGDATCSVGFTIGTVTNSHVSTITNYRALDLPATVTAGLEKLTDGAVLTTAMTTPPPTPVATLPGTNNQTAGGGNAGTSTTSTSTAGVPRITQNAVLAGVAAVMGGGAMLVGGL
ncbi:hypothetical protein B0H63DRAFT_109555 [Podospora didyma]|uniref:Uncharacterized protein n=1 Tax=Podospora didyma TaxID=330526 RepID=A0AAE0NYN7_9PEZI|nr:hypothetical protein B0H63DRAFT_109555 [Podospora didyma]